MWDIVSEERTKIVKDFEEAVAEKGICSVTNIDVAHLGSSEFENMLPKSDIEEPSVVFVHNVEDATPGIWACLHLYMKEKTDLSHLSPSCCIVVFGNSANHKWCDPGITTSVAHFNL